MPGMYHGEDYDLAGFAVGACERDKLLPSEELKEGDVLLGLASSGVHSNGFSLVRKIVDLSGLSYQDPAPFRSASSGETLGQCLLEPTRIYVKSLLHAIRETDAVKAMAHITGGGFPENIPRVLPDNLAAEVDLSAIHVPEVFSWLSKTGGVAPNEMLRTFNCGVGMIVATGAENAQAVAEALTDAGETVIPLGHVIERGDNEGVVYKGQLAI